MKEDNKGKRNYKENSYHRIHKYLKNQLVYYQNNVYWISNLGIIKYGLMLFNLIINGSKLKKS